MIYAIDGSNVLLGVRLNKKPSDRLLARLLHALRDRHDEFQLFFDNSIENTMAREGLLTEWRTFRDALPAAGIRPVFAARADTPIEDFCKLRGAAVINSSDKIDSWNTRPSFIHRARVLRMKNGLRLALIDDASGQFVFNVDADDSFEFGGIHYPALTPQTTLVESLIAPDTQYPQVVAEGTLLVLALDASGSMGESDSFDGRPKSDHLNEIVKLAINRLRNSRIGEGLYIAILRFENDVTRLLCPLTSKPFASVNDWFQVIETFDYMNGATPGLTNIRLALQRSKELIQDTLADSEAVSALADEWRAAVVVITDGNHVVMRQDGSRETDEDVAHQALDIHGGLSGLIGGRIDVGCVGIGTDLNRTLITKIASLCTPTQQKMARNSGIAQLLIESRLCIVVDSKNENFGEAIRTFIDVASSAG